MQLPMVDPPTYMQIEPVGQCNLRCQMCPIQYRQDGPPHGPPAFMKFETFTALLDQSPELKELHLQGLGEPMMHPRFFDMIQYAAAKGIEVSTNTNATLLNIKRAERCVTSGLAWLHASLDAASAETYERIRIRAKFDRVVANLRLLVAAKQLLGSARPQIRMVIVVMRQNLHELPDLIRLSHELMIETVFVQHLCHDFGEASLPAHYQGMRAFVDQQTLLNENPERIQRYFAEARHQANQYHIELRLPSILPNGHPTQTLGKERCDWPWRGPYISYEGMVMPCCMVATPDRVNFGRTDENGVQQIWNNQAYQHFRERLSSPNPPDVCQSCSVYSGVF